MRCSLCRPRYRGFTLVETLAVVALLAVIAVMATPSFVAWHVRDQVDARAKALAVDACLCAQRGVTPRRTRHRVPDRRGAALSCLGAAVRQWRHRLVMRLGRAGRAQAARFRCCERNRCLRQ